MTSLHHDLRFALRQLRRAPAFTVTAVLTLALSIGATTAVFSLVRAILLSPLPYPEASRLVGISFSTPAEPPGAEQVGITADFLLNHATSFASMGVADSGPRDANLSVPNDLGQPLSETVRALRVSSSYLPTLGVAPLLGRTFSAADDLPGAAPTAVLSHSLWRRAFHADPHVLGSLLHLNGDTYTVIGVMPASFATTDAPELWQPLHLSSADPGYIGTNYQFIARLRPGVTPAQAAAELTTFNAAIYREFPAVRHWSRPGAPLMTERLFPLELVVASEARPSLLTLSAAVLAVLLLACLNLAGLSAVRGAARQTEITVRSALGAHRSDIVRTLLTESFLIALAGSLLGLGVARYLLAALLHNSPIDLPLLNTPSIDLRAVLFAVLAGAGTVLVVGLLPALDALRQGSTSPLTGARTVGATVSAGRTGRYFLVAQVCLATALLSAGALLLGTFLHLRATPSGIEPDHLFALQVNLKGTGYASASHTRQFIAAVEDRLRALPGVQLVGTVNGLPLDSGLNNSGGPALHPDQVALAQTRFITPGYLGTAQLPLLAGTDISAADTATSPPVALISQRAARMWFADRSPIGENILDGGTTMRVIGIVADVRDGSLAEPAQPTVYLPYAQLADDTVGMINGWFPTTFLLRVAGPDTTGGALGHAVALTVASVDPEVPVGKFVAVQTFVDRSVAAPRFFSWLSGAFALFALFLTTLGLFGLLSYQVTGRTREIGVRMALGSSRGGILGLVLSSGLRLTALGLVLGLALSAALRRPLTSLLADLTRTDAHDLAPLLLNHASSACLAAAAMLLASTLAALLPARRAASTDPNVALRAE